MVFPRTLHLLAGAVAGLGSALWLTAAGSLGGVIAVGGVLALAPTLAVTLIAVLAMLVTTVGTLVAADWRADVQSRQAWAQIDVAMAELWPPSGTATPSQIDPRYLAAVDIEALRSVFRAYRFASPAPTIEPMPASLVAVRATRLAEPGESTLALTVQETTAKTTRKKGISRVAVSETALSRRATAMAANVTHAEAPILVALYREPPQPRRAKLTASRTRLIVNASTWSGWPSCDQHILTHAPPGGHIADLVILGSRRDDRDRREPPPDPSTSGNIASSAGPPSCRGPPSVARQRWRTPEVAPAEPSVESGPPRQGSALPQADPVVVDNFGKRVPVCAVELDVIETYLEKVLRDLLASPTAAPEQEKT